MRRLRNVAIGALCISMCLGSFPITSYGETLDSAVESMTGSSADVSSTDSQENLTDGSSTDNQENLTDGSSAGSQEDPAGGSSTDSQENPAGSSSTDSQEDPADSSSVNTQEGIVDSSSGSQEESEIPASSGSQESTVSGSSKEEETQSPIEITGVFGCSVEDQNGTVIDGWYSQDDGCYYMFLTRACTISDISLQVSGVLVSETSAGQIDAATNTIKGAFAASGDGISIRDDSGNSYKIVVMQSDLPSLSITLNNTDIDTVNQGDKDTKYTGNSLVITDTDGSVDLSQEKVEFKGRGNTTWALSDKKGYQIKFDKKQKVLGMAKAKKWVLLANAFDDSLMRNTVAFKLADRLGMTFAADFEYVDLWVNGEYRGNYIIGEKNEINSNRLDLSDNEGILCEYDNLYYAGEDIWFQTDYTGEYFTVKESVSDNTEDINAGVASFQKNYNDFIKYICNTDRNAITLDGLSNYIDVESAAQYYLITEYMGNYESYYTSYYMYKDGKDDVIHFGPVWDFDTCQGAYALDYCAYVTLIYRNLLQAPAFSNYVKNYYNQNIDAFYEIQNDIASIGNSISSSAAMNYVRWNWLGKENQKNPGLPFESTYEKAVQALANWHSRRVSSFQAGKADWKWYIQNNNLVVDITEEGCTNVQVAIWHKDDMSDLQWITAKKSGQSWIATTSLSTIRESGVYNVHVYDMDSYGNATIIAAMSNYMDQTVKADIYAEQTSETQISLQAKNASSCSSVRFAVWSKENGQDDLIWYNGKKDSKGNWTAAVDLKKHVSSGTYYVHAYAGNTFLGGTTCSVTLASPTVTVTKEESSNQVTAAITCASAFTNVRAGVWGDQDGQNDLTWYKATKNQDGSYTITCNLENHGEIGKYNVHVYASFKGKDYYLGGSTLQVTSVKALALTTDLSESGRVLTLSLEGAAAYTNVRAAIWGSPNGQNDLTWVAGSKDNQGNWTFRADIASHGEKGTYYIHVYGVRNGKNQCIICKNIQVDQIQNPSVQVISQDTNIQVTCTNAEDYTEVKYAVWNTQNGQDDLRWYTASKDSQSIWQGTVAKVNHRGSGKLTVHVYGVKDGKNTFLGGGSIAA